MDDESRRYFKRRDKRRQRMRDKGVTYLPGVDYRLSERARKFIADRSSGNAQILIVCPEGLRGWVDSGDLVIHENTYYTRDEIGPHGLDIWANKNAAGLIRHYQQCLNSGSPADIVLFVTPESDYIDSDKCRISVHSREEIIDIMLKNLKSPPVETFKRPAKAGHFWLFISKGDGLLKGSVTAMLPVVIPSQN